MSDPSDVVVAIEVLRITICRCFIGLVLVLFGMTIAIWHRPK